MPRYRSCDGLETLWRHCDGEVDVGGKMSLCSTWYPSSMRWLIPVLCWGLLATACGPQPSSPAGSDPSHGGSRTSMDAGDADHISDDTGVPDPSEPDGSPADAGEPDGEDAGAEGIEEGADAEEGDVADGGAEETGPAVTDANGPDPLLEDAGSLDASTAVNSTGEAGTGDDAGDPPADAGTPDGGELGPVCPVGQTLCNQDCVFTSYDPNHCGGCNSVCNAGPGASAACIVGGCVSACDEGETLCGGACVDLSTDLQNCGGCNRSCDSPLDGFVTCELGHCIDSCLPTDALCGEVCVRVVDDLQNCGDCGVVCEAPTGGAVDCRDFVCEPRCLEEESLCATECINLVNRSDHCGGCQQSCAANTHCVDSVCVRDAPLLSAVTPNLVHTHANALVVIHGERLHAPVTVVLERGEDQWALAEVLSSENALQVRLPPGLSPGRYSLSAETPSGRSRLVDALDVVDGSLYIEVLQAAQGDAQIVTGPSGVTMLIDGSLSTIGTDVLRPRFNAPPDYVVVTHYDADHLSGVYALLAGPDQIPNTDDDVEPTVALLDHGDNHSCGSQLCTDFLTLRDRLERIGKARTIVAGEVIPLGAGATATCVLVNGEIAEQPRVITAHENENSVGLLIDFLGFRYLTAGDVTGGPIVGCPAAIAGDFVDVETPLARLTGGLDVLKVAHHGSCTATPLTFSALAQPQVSIVSMGENNSFCHPSKRVLRNLHHAHSDLYLTNPGISDPANAAGCSVSDLPQTTAPFFGDVWVRVPGDGTFSVHVGTPEDQGDGIVVPNEEVTGTAADMDAGIDSLDSGPQAGTTWYRKTYEVKGPRVAGRLALPLNSSEGTLEFLGDSTAHPVGAPLVIRSSSPWVDTTAYLVPVDVTTDGLIQAVEAGSLPLTLLQVMATSEGNLLTLRPAVPLAANASFTLIFPASTTGGTQTSWLTFSTGLLLPQGPAYELASLPTAVEGVVINLPAVTIDFTEPVIGITGDPSQRNLFLEEVETGAEVVMGAVTQSREGARVTLTLPQGNRTGPSGERCEALCPNMTYAVRALGSITSQTGIPIENRTLLTFTTAKCTDSTAPAIDRVDVETFPTAVSISIFASEPLQGWIELLEGATAEFDCASPGDAACAQIPLMRGECASDPCSPIAGACHHYIVAEDIKANTEYGWKLYGADFLGNEFDVRSGIFNTASPSRTLVMQEVFADSQQPTESFGEYIEIVNVSSLPVDVCNFRIGKDLGAMKDICTAQEILLAPSEAGLVVGNNFCLSQSDTCSPEFTFPASLQVFRQTTASLLGGLNNTSLFPLFLVDDAGNTVSQLEGVPVCGPGIAVHRTSPYAPDDSTLWRCATPSPGQN